MFSSSCLNIVRHTHFYFVFSLASTTLFAVLFVAVSRLIVVIASLCWAMVKWVVVGNFTCVKTNRLMNSIWASFLLIKTVVFLLRCVGLVFWSLTTGIGFCCVVAAVALARIFLLEAIIIVILSWLVASSVIMGTLIFGRVEIRTSFVRCVIVRARCRSTREIESRIHQSLVDSCYVILWCLRSWEGNFFSDFISYIFDAKRRRLWFRFWGLNFGQLFTFLSRRGAFEGIGDWNVSQVRFMSTTRRFLSWTSVNMRFE